MLSISLLIRLVLRWVLKLDIIESNDMSPDDESPDIVRFTPLDKDGGSGDSLDDCCFDFRKLRDLPTPNLGTAAGNTDCNSEVDSSFADTSDKESPEDIAVLLVGDVLGGGGGGGRGLINEDDPPENDLVMPRRDLDVFLLLLLLLLRKLRDLPGVLLRAGK